MDIKEIRRNNLELLVARAGTAVILGNRAGIDPKQISHILNGVRNMGHKLAAKLETSEGLQHGAMDQPLTGLVIAGIKPNGDPPMQYRVKREDEALPQLTPEAIDVAQAWMCLPPERQKSYRDFILVEIVARTLTPWLAPGISNSLDFKSFSARLKAEQAEFAAARPAKPVIVKK